MAKAEVRRNASATDFPYALGPPARHVRHGNLPYPPAIDLSRVLFVYLRSPQFCSHRSASCRDWRATFFSRFWLAIRRSVPAAALLRPKIRWLWLLPPPVVAVPDDVHVDVVAARAAALVRRRDGRRDASCGHQDRAIDGRWLPKNVYDAARWPRPSVCGASFP
jgi:hypothetical protein